MGNEVAVADSEVPNQAFLVRSIHPADDPAVFLNLAIKAMRGENPGYHIVDSDKYDDLINPLNFYTVENQGDFLVAEVNGRIVGFGAFMKYFEPTEITTCYFRRLRVDPEYQRLGIGQKLISERERLARDMGYEAARVITTSRNQAVYNLLLKNGFGVIDQTLIHDAEIDADVTEYLMEKPLTVSNG